MKTTALKEGDLFVLSDKFNDISIGYFLKLEDDQTFSNNFWSPEIVTYIGLNNLFFRHQKTFKQSISDCQKIEQHVARKSTFYKLDSIKDIQNLQDKLTEDQLEFLNLFKDQFIRREQLLTSSNLEIQDWAKKQL